MAFGFFKKAAAADLVLYNGKFITQESDSDDITAVACADGKIVSAGSYEDMEELIDEETLTVDLQGKFVLPGFVDIFSSPVTEVFKDRYADLSRCGDLQSLYSHVKLFADENPDCEVIFGYGYSEKLLLEANSDYQEAIRDEELMRKIMKMLDEACPDRPVILLCENTVSCLLNTAASDTVKETAEEEMVQYITVPYILNLMIPFDFEALEQDVRSQIEKMNRHGFTAALDLGVPDYFEDLYIDSLISFYNEEVLHQRFFGSYLMNRPLMPDGLVHRLMARKTQCNEIGDYINANALYIELNGEACPLDFSQDALNSIMTRVSDKGFSIFISAAGMDDYLMAYNAVEYIRSKGCQGLVAIRSTHKSDSLANEFVHWESAAKLPSFSDISSMTSEELIDLLTAEAAALTGTEQFIGTIRKGKFADMAVFDRDPFKISPEELLCQPVSMTIFNGKII